MNPRNASLRNSRSCSARPARRQATPMLLFQPGQDRGFELGHDLSRAGGIIFGQIASHIHQPQSILTPNR